MKFNTIRFILLSFTMSLSLPYATFAAESCTTSQISADEEEFRGIGGSSDTNVIAVYYYNKLYSFKYF